MRLFRAVAPVLSSALLALPCSASAQLTSDSTGLLIGLRATTQSAMVVRGIIDVARIGSTPQYTERIGASSGVEGSFGFQFLPSLSLYTELGVRQGTGSREIIAIQQRQKEAVTLARWALPLRPIAPYAEAGIGIFEIDEGPHTASIWPHTNGMRGNIAQAGLGALIGVGRGIRIDIGADVRRANASSLIIGKFEHDGVNSSRLEPAIRVGVSVRAIPNRAAVPLSRLWRPSIEDLPVVELQRVRIHAPEIVVAGFVTKVDLDTIVVQLGRGDVLRQIIVPTRCIESVDRSVGKQQPVAVLLRDIWQGATLASAAFVAMRFFAASARTTPANVVVPAAGIGAAAGATLWSLRERDIWQSIPIDEVRPQPTAADRCDRVGR